MTVIVFKLTDGMEKFQALTGHKPTRIYLGHNEHDAFVKEAKQFTVVPEKAWTMRAHFNGVPVYSIDAANHVGFGLDLPA